VVQYQKKENWGNKNERGRDKQRLTETGQGMPRTAAEKPRKKKKGNQMGGKKKACRKVKKDEWIKVGAAQHRQRESWLKREGGTTWRPQEMRARGSGTAKGGSRPLKINWEGQTWLGKILKPDKGPQKTHSKPPMSGEH